MQEALAARSSPGYELAPAWDDPQHGLGETAGAEQAYKRRVSRCDQGLYDAQLSLGLLYFGVKRFLRSRDPSAQKSPRRLTPQINAPVEACYAQALSHTGAFRGGGRRIPARCQISIQTTSAITQKAAQAQFMPPTLSRASRLTKPRQATCRSWPGIEGDADVAKISRQDLSSPERLWAQGRRAEARRSKSRCQPPLIPNCPTFYRSCAGKLIARAPGRLCCRAFRPIRGGVR